ncbi:MAG: hypothetical protein V4478_02710 [Patescibacteria group bacterium]
MDIQELQDALRIKDPEAMVPAVEKFFVRMHQVTHENSHKLVAMYSAVTLLHECGFNHPHVRAIKRSIKARMVLLRKIAPAQTRENAQALADLISVDEHMTFADKNLAELL